MKAANPQQLYICLSRMHHIVNPKKFRRLRREAEANDVFGFVKTGYPGVVVVEGSQRGVEGFLRGARGLRYLEFHHLSTEPAFPRASSRPPLPSLTDSSGSDITSTAKIMADFAPGARSGLHEVGNMKEMVESMDRIGRKTWFREAMGMSGT